MADLRNSIGSDVKTPTHTYASTTQRELMLTHSCIVRESSGAPVITIIMEKKKKFEIAIFFTPSSLPVSWHLPWWHTAKSIWLNFADCQNVSPVQLVCEQLKVSINHDMGASWNFAWWDGTTTHCKPVWLHCGSWRGGRKWHVLFCHALHTS